jgi:2Fe-2S ferredoxin
MPRIHVRDPAGTASTVEAETGASLMEALRRRGLVEAVCGGQCACATCHVHIAEAWLPLAGDPGETEQALLDNSMECRPNSRLSCQIIVTVAMEGLSLDVALPEG